MTEEFAVDVVHVSDLHDKNNFNDPFSMDLTPVSRSTHMTYLVQLLCELGDKNRGKLP